MKAELSRQMRSFSSPFKTAERFWVEEIIDPAETRPLLTEFARLSAPLRDRGEKKPRYRP